MNCSIKSKESNATTEVRTDVFSVIPSDCVAYKLHVQLADLTILNQACLVIISNVVAAIPGDHIQKNPERSVPISFIVNHVENCGLHENGNQLLANISHPIKAKLLPVTLVSIDNHELFITGAVVVNELANLPIVSNAVAMVIFGIATELPFAAEVTLPLASTVILADV